MPFEIVEDREQIDREFNSAFVYLNDGEVEPELPDEWEYEYEPDESFDAEYFEERRGSLIGVTPSRFVEFAIMLPDKESNTYKRFDFSQRRYLRQIYDTPSIRTLLKCGRQVEKSTLLGNKLLSYSCINSAMNCLYVSPTNLQTKTFSNDRLREPIETSPYLKAWTTSKLVDSISLKKFINRSQITLRYAFLNADRCRGIPADIICYDKNAQVLTRQGWKLVSELTSSDEVADVDDNGEVTWCPPTRIIKRNYSGEMVTFNHAGISLRVTGDHQMWVNFKIKPASPSLDKYRFVSASDLAGTKTMGFKMTSEASWSQNGPAPSYLSLPGIPTCHGREKNALIVPSKEIARLVGWYISEGHIQWSHWKGERTYARPVITQNADRYLDEITHTIEACGLTYRVHQLRKDKKSRSVVINSAILGSYFCNLGKSRDKYIPREFFDYPELLEEILKGIYLGDAMYHPGESWDHGTLRTRSIRLAEDVQEAWLRLGRPAVIHTRMHDVKHQDDVDYGLLPKEPMYEVCAYVQNYSIFWRAEFETKNRVVTEQVNNEEVYCFTVSHHRPIIKGGFGQKPLISGNCLDEVQDLLTDNIGVIEQCASHSVLNIGGKTHKGGIFMYSGTPKSLDNTLEFYWQNQSTQNEWAVPCHRHAIQTGDKISSVYWNILDEDNIGQKGIVCDKCHNPIDVADAMAQWVSLNPGILKSATIKTPFEGFRIPQLMVPWISHNAILQNQATYSRATFYNEVLGLSYDSGTRPLTQQDVIDNCDSRLLLTPEYQNSLLKFLGAAFPVYAGIDWGTGENSYTVISLGAYMADGRFTIFYVHRFEGREAEPQVQIEEISKLMNKFRIRLAGCDYGGGFWPNDELTRRFGFQRVPRYQYSQPSTKVIYQPGLSRFLVHRTEVMSDVFNAIKRRNVFRFPNWEQFQTPFASDMLSIFSEYNEQIRQNVYKKSLNNTDDTFHSILLCFLASMIHYPRPDVIAPNSSHGRPPKDKEENN